MKQAGTFLNRHVLAHTTTDSSSSESESDSKEGTQANKKVPVLPSCAERDTSVTLSSGKLPLSVSSINSNPL